jgi:hypothetical protein
MSINDLTALVTAIAGLVAAVAQLVRMWRWPP